jgi:hypothetical protein
MNVQNPLQVERRMSKYPTSETVVLRGILAIIRANQGRRTTIHVKKVQRYGGIGNLPPTIIGKSLAQLERKGILDPYFIGSRRIYLVNLPNLVNELARTNATSDKERPA